MSMFCFQCQEAAKNTGCTVRGMCGKLPETSGYQDLLLYTLKGLAVRAAASSDAGLKMRAGKLTARALFATITNGNFDDARFKDLIREVLALRGRFPLPAEVGGGANGSRAGTVRSGACDWEAPEEAWLLKSASVGVLSEPDEDVRSLVELVTYGLKGIAAYATHALALGYEDDALWIFLLDALSAVYGEKTASSLISLALETGEAAVKAMALLDRANTDTYGTPEITNVNIGVRKNPGILVSGHDLRDLEELLRQTDGTGVDVYTHGEMLPAHYYPAFKKYPHFAGNYGNAWWKQDREFESFNGPILMTTNCLVPVKDSYRNRIFTTGIVGFPGLPHIAEARNGGMKDFSSIVALAKTCPSPTEIETGEITGGFAHAQMAALADTIVGAVKSGAVGRFVVMAGCDGRQGSRSYFTEVAERLPENAVILTAGCAKYRYNKLDLGSIGGIPRVLDAGQCNDSYSLVLTALKLKEAFGLADINELPISFDLAWYEQKAVAVLLALLHLGVKGIRLGPTLPAFLSPGVVKILVETFDIKPTGDAEADVALMMEGK